MYKIILEKSAKKFIQKQPKNKQQKIYNAIKQLPYGNDIKKLKGYINKYRLRVNDYRIIYDKFDDTYIIDIIDVDNRGQVYKKI
jgi:mRNA interferase RelE/StbE